MKLWHISQDKNNDYDTFSDAVVAAETEENARTIHPRGEEEEEYLGIGIREWADIEFVRVKYLGEAKEGTKRGVICASYHAG